MSERRRGMTYPTLGTNTVALSCRCGKLTGSGPEGTVLHCGVCDDEPTEGPPS